MTSARKPLFRTPCGTVKNILVQAEVLIIHNKKIKACIIIISCLLHIFSHSRLFDTRASGLKIPKS